MYLILLLFQLALKHRQGKNHSQRIVAFVGSPIENEEKDLVKLAKRLKKEKVNVDVINFGEEVRRLVILLSDCVAVFANNKLLCSYRRTFYVKYIG